MGRGDNIARGVFVIFLIIVLGLVLVSGDVFQDLTQGDFNGTYNWTFYNSSGFVQLNNSYLTGTYTSRVFDATSAARWNNLTAQNNLLYSEYLYALDNNRAVFKSSNNGTTWTQTNSQYYNQDCYGMTSDSNGNLYIAAKDKSVHKSTDSGVTWTQIATNAFAGEPRGITTDSNNNLYATVKEKMFYSSSDSGATWTLVNNAYSSSNTANEYCIALQTLHTNLSFQIRNCSSSDCSDGTWQTINLNNINLTGRYLQYKVYFSSQDTSISPELYNVSIDYTILDNTPPNILFVSPTPANNSIQSANSIYINITTNDTSQYYTFINFNSSLTGFYKMNESSGAIIDYSGKGNNGTQNGGVTYGFTGKFGNAIGFDGVNDYINFGNINNFERTDSFSYSLWVKTKSTTSWMAMLSKKTTPSLVGMHLFNQVGNPRFYLIGSVGSIDVSGGVNNLNNGLWHHLVITYNGSGNATGVKIYADGSQKTTSIIANNLNSSILNSGNFQVSGRGGTDNCFNGSIDEVMVFNRVLSTDEISALYNASSYSNNFTNLQDGNYSFYAYTQDVYGNENQTEIRTIKLDNTPPSINIMLPEEKTYSYNTSLALNYSISDFSEISSCWYNLDNGNNITLPSCQNTTFNVSQGSHRLNLFANDSLGLVNFSSINFFVDSINPNIFFSTGTTNAGTYSNLNSIFVNVSTSDANQRYSFINFNNSLLLHYKMDESSGNLIDYSGNNQIAITQNANAMYNMQGMFGDGVQFDENSWFRLGKDNINFTNNNFTISFWIKPGRFTVSWTPLAKGTVASYNSPFFFYGISAGHLRFYTGNALCTGWELDGNSRSFYTLITLNEWQLITVTKSGNNYSLYKNAILIKNVATSSDTICSNSLGYNITVGGTRTGAQLINGTMDEVLIFNRDLSLEEISALYNSSSYSRNFTGISCGEYNVHAYSQDIAGNENSTEIRNYTLSANSPPSLNIVLPQNNSNYKYNSNIPLEYTISDVDGNLDSCWYNLDNGNNITLPSCQNTTFNVSQGSHRLNLFANDSLNEQSLSNAIFFVDSIHPLISIISPANGTKTTNNSIAVRYVVSDANLDSCWYSLNNGVTNMTVGCGDNITGKTWNQGQNIIFIWANDSLGNENFSHVTFFVDSIRPLISLISPKNGDSYGYNSSIALNYNVSDANLDSCWYVLNSGNPIKIPNCENTAIDVAEGSNNLSVYVNDSYGLESFDSAVFNVQLGAPSIILNIPLENSYLNNGDVEFVYIPEDIDLEACELWGNFNGSWGLSRVDENPFSGIENSFSIALENGVYKWNIRCNDSIGNSAWNGNKTFYVDTLSPAISINSPSGKQTARTRIPLIFSVSDVSPLTCWYNLTYDSGGVWIPYPGKEVAVMISNCSSTSFNVSNDYSYILYLTANDSAGNKNYASSDFNVDTSTPVNPPSGGGGDSSGGGGIISNKTTQSGQISLSKIDPIITYAGNKKTLSLNVKNSGKIFLNNCRLVANGEISNWLYSKQVQGIAPGENVNFIFDLNIPEETKSGDYSLGLEVNCDEIKQSQNLAITIPFSSQIIRIKEIKQDRNLLNITYDFDGSSSTGEEVKIELWIVDEDNIEIKRINDNFIANQGINERQVSIELPNGLVGIYTVYLADSSDLSNPVKQTVVLGKSSLSGFTILDQPGNKMIAYAVFLIIIGAGIFFIMWNSGKKKKIHKKVKVIDKGLKKYTIKNDDEDEEDDE